MRGASITFLAVALEFRQASESEGDVDALGDQILIPIVGQQFDTKRRMRRQKLRQPGDDLPEYEARRGTDAKHPAQLSGAARLVVCLVERG